MLRDKKLLFNTAFLTGTTLLMRAVSMVFQIWLSKKIGAAGLGLYYLILSVNMLAATFAVSGIRFAATRLVSEEAGYGRNDGILSAVRNCMVYAAVFGTAAAVILFSSAGYIGEALIGDARTVLSLKILSFSMPFLSVGAVLGGYFTAVCKVVKSASEQVVEQVIKIAAVVAALSFVPWGDTRLACAAVITGSVAGEVASFFIIFGLYLADIRKCRKVKIKAEKMASRMISIAMPLALSAYVRAALSTIQNLLIPRGLKKFGSTSDKALADYGTIQGMVLPVIAFPSALFVSLSELLVPELTRAQVNCRTDQIHTIVSRVMRLCALFSIGIAGILFAFSDELGYAIYNNKEIGYYVKRLALFVPILYMDSITDGMLRGLGQQMYSMKYNIIESIASTVLIYFLIPRFAVSGLIFVLYFSEAFNFFMSIKRLVKVTEYRPKILNIFKLSTAILAAVSLTAFFLRSVGVELTGSPFSAAVHIVISAAAYYMLARLFGAMEREDDEWIRKMFRIAAGELTRKKRRRTGKSL